MKNDVYDIIKKFPADIRCYFDNIKTDNLCEIRFRTGRYIMLCYGMEKNIKLGRKKMTPADVSSVFSCLLQGSVYAFKDDISKGFITIGGGHRIGICGRCIESGENITNICDISGINIRIAREFIGCANEIMPFIRGGGKVSNTIIIAPPACGKTTLLRDIARNLSENLKVTIIDERSEIAAVSDGISSFDIGSQTDIFDSCPKDKGMVMALRSMSPDVIITDEIGTKADLRALSAVKGAGVKVVASVHGSGTEEVFGSEKELFSIFEKAVFINRRGNNFLYEKKYLRNF